ncbi:MAG: thioredoxin [Chloroflexi bacterium]|nr:thioredoxin [Chloroflexota bacterium]
MSHPLRFTDANFEQEVLGAEIPVLVDFWASWCPPCKMVEPVIAELAEEYDGKIKVGKLNVDQNPQVAARYNILGVPTFIVFSAGHARERRTGAQSKAQLKDLLRGVLTMAEGTDAHVPASADQDIDEEEEEQILARLRALGYAD